MSLLEPEHNPAEIQSTETEFITAVEHCFRALRTGAYDLVRLPAEILEASGSYFAAGLAEASKEMELIVDHSDIGNQVESLELLKKDIFGRALRAYVYSGVGIDAGLIHKSADYVGLSLRELRIAIRPTPKLLFAHHVHAPEHKRVVRQRGHEVICQLGLAPFYGGRLMRVLDQAKI